MSSLSDAGRELANLMESTRTHLGALRPRPQEQGEYARKEGMATDRDGLVRARLNADGRLAELELDERTALIPRTELQRAIIEAVNKAWAVGQGADPDDVTAASIDPEALARQLTDTRDEAMRSMNRITEGLLDAMRQIEQATKR